MTASHWWAQAHLPDWLCNLVRGRAGSMVALDTCWDNLCLWSCIAVHHSALPHRSLQAQSCSKQLPKNVTRYTRSGQKTAESGKPCLELAQDLSLGACARARREALWHFRRNPLAKLKNILTIGIYVGHTFVIEDVAKLAKSYACAHCRAHFTESCNLLRHAQSCALLRDWLCYCNDLGVSLGLEALEKMQVFLH